MGFGFSQWHTLWSFETYNSKHGTQLALYYKETPRSKLLLLLLFLREVLCFCRLTFECPQVTEAEVALMYSWPVRWYTLVLTCLFLAHIKSCDWDLFSIIVVPNVNSFRNWSHCQVILYSIKFTSSWFSDLK